VVDTPVHPIRCSTVDMAASSGIEKGFEHRQPIDMVPMAVGDEYMDFNRFLGGQGLAERKDSGSAVQHQPRIAIGPNFDTGRVAPVANRLWPGRWDRTTDSPEFEFHRRSTSPGTRATDNKKKPTERGPLRLTFRGLMGQIIV